MTILYDIEGPKGSGKSTLTQMLMSTGVADELHYYDGNWETLVTESSVYADHNSKFKFIHERGFLSQIIYTLMSDANPDFEGRSFYDGPKMTFSTWRVTPLPTMLNYIDLLHHKLVIMYADDPELLLDRITKRKEQTGKYATEAELQVLKNSNILFKYFGQMLKELRPDKVMLFKIEHFGSTEAIMKSVLQEG